MGRLLLNLRHVPDDEADEVREMLTEADIPFYETPLNRWGITVGGIWVRDPEALPRAKTLMAEYQRDRQARALADRAARRAEGRLETFMGVVKNQPLQIIGTLAAGVVIVYLMLYPFINLGTA